MKKKFLLFLLGTFFLNISNAWSGHYLITYYSLASLNKTVYSQKIRVESLQDFLESVKDKLPQELQHIESWAIKTQTAYKAQPSILKFDPNNALCAKNITVCFKMALRLNLDVPLKSVIYDPNNVMVNIPVVKDVSAFMLKEVSTQASHLIGDNQFKMVKVGDMVPLSTVISASSEEPDWGFDIALYQNNNSEFGKIYGFGNQPIGDVGLTYTSQSLFHMATYKLSKIFTVLRPDLKYSYAQYRFYEFMHLAEFAWANGHPYWAAKFSGWAVHYLQDMTQPYHANLFNGFRDVEVLFAYFNSLLKNNKPIVSLQNKLQERHMISEDIAGYLLSDNNKNFAVARQRMQNFLREQKYDETIPNCTMGYNYLTQVVVPQTYTFGQEYSISLLNIFPHELVDNPSGVDFDKINYTSVFMNLSEENKEKLLQLYANRMGYVASYTRSCINLVF